MTAIYQTPNLDDLSQYFINAFPAMNSDEQRLALGIYELLAEGCPVTFEQLSRHVAINESIIKAVLDHWLGVFYDAQNRIIGFWGITINEMNHQLKVKGKTVYAWCAWDALFIPALLNETTYVTSHCMTTDEEISLTISPDRIDSYSPQDIMVSFITPNENEFNENITSNFCHFVHFFSSSEAGEQWIANHEGTFLLSLNDAFMVGKKMNAIRYQQIHKI